MRSAAIRAWRMEQLIRDLALGEKSMTELAEIHGVEEQTVRVFKMNHKPEIDAIVHGWTDQYDHIWSTKLENRLRVLTCRLEETEDQIAVIKDHARRETETIRSVDPEASEVLFNCPEYRAYVKEQRALIREISEQTGQLPRRRNEGSRNNRVPNSGRRVRSFGIEGQALFRLLFSVWSTGEQRGRSAYRRADPTFQ